MQAPQHTYPAHVLGKSALKSLLMVLSLTFSVGGCTGDSQHGTVSGTVTLNGKPLKSGLIRFIPVGGQTASADATITDGKFTAIVPIGEKQVWVSAPKVVGQRKTSDRPDSPMVDIVDELLPVEYNAASKMTLSVTAGSQTKSYDLKSGK
jgi:hypothetical protein